MKTNRERQQQPNKKVAALPRPVVPPVQRQSVWKRKSVKISIFVIIVLVACFVVYKKVATPPPPVAQMSITDKDFKNEPLESCVDQVKLLITPHVDDKELGSNVKEVLTKLPDYKVLFDKAQKVAKGLQIDVILQDHGEADQQARKDPRVIKSQLKVFHALTYGNYDVVALEGFDIDPITLDGLAHQDLEHNFKVFGTKGSLEQAREALRQDFAIWGGMKYLIQSQSLKGMGIEYYPLNQLHRKVLDDEISHVKGLKVNLAIEDLHNLGDKLSLLRSKLAVVKTVLKLRETETTRGVIVIGYGHAEDISKILQHLHISSNFFLTIDEGN